jgi:hypothetical protein
MSLQNHTRKIQNYHTASLDKARIIRKNKALSFKREQDAGEPKPRPQHPARIIQIYHTVVSGTVRPIRNNKATLPDFQRKQNRFSAVREELK